MDIMLTIKKNYLKKVQDKIKKIGKHIVNTDCKTLVLYDINIITAVELAKKIDELYNVKGVEIVKPIPNEDQKIKGVYRAGKWSKNIFVVHGRDETDLKDIKKIMIRWGLHPIILKEKPAGGMKTIIEKLEKYGTDIGFAIILFTPDDLGKFNDKISKNKFRARQNVIYEAGLFSGKLTRDRVIGLFKGKKYSIMEWPTDLGGIEMITYKEKISEISERIEEELKIAGYRKPKSKKK